MKRSSAMQCMAAAILLTGLSNFAVAAVEAPRGVVVVADVQPVAVATVVPDQFIDAQQLRIDTVVGTSDATVVSAHRTVTAWQINTGKWNGQNLDGLSLVLVQNTSNDPANSGELAIYVSDYATAAQRDALLEAMTASHPGLFITRDGSYRIEPACIRIEQVNGSTVVLHLGTIA